MSYRRDKKGIFGLTAIQQFFVVILGLAILSYVIVIIMGTLNSSSINSILAYTSGTVTNESVGPINTTVGVTIAKTTVSGFSGPALTAVYNTTFNNGSGISLANFTLASNGTLTATSTGFGCGGASCIASYTYQYYSAAQNQTSYILTNVSNGITSFFGNINPVYAILAVLVIILVLVVLVRVVSGGQGMTGGGAAAVPL